RATARQASAATTKPSTQAGSSAGAGSAASRPRIAHALRAGDAQERRTRRGRRLLGPAVLLVGRFRCSLMRPSGRRPDEVRQLSGGPQCARLGEASWRVSGALPRTVAPKRDRLSLLLGPRLTTIVKRPATLLAGEFR